MPVTYIYGGAIAGVRGDGEHEGDGNHRAYHGMQKFEAKTKAWSRIAGVLCFSLQCSLE